MKQCFFAVDLGATSGRTILGTFTPEGLEMEDVNRFPNHLIETGGHFYWDIYELYRHIIEGLKIVAQKKDVEITSIGIDTWGVDFVCVGKDGGFLRQPYSYRDPHTAGAPEAFFKKVARKQVYEWTGIQVMNFNSLFQLDTLRRNNDSALAAADKLLFIPDALSYMLTGEMVTEYTIASTAQLVNANTRKPEDALLRELGLTENNFGRFVYPGEKIGTLTKEVQRMTGLGDIPVIAVAGHDTASAVASVPAMNPDFAYLSSGTWSLLGTELDTPVIDENSEKYNITNEGGCEYKTSFLKNIIGTWLIQESRRQWIREGQEYGFGELETMAKEVSALQSFIDPDAPEFGPAGNIPRRIREYCEKSGQAIPETIGEIVCCIDQSLALKYRMALEEIESCTGKHYNTIYIVGGGTQSKLLCQFTANACGRKVITGPVEATVLGNLVMQLYAAGDVPEIHDLQTARDLIARSSEITEYEPQNVETWAEAYERFKKVIEA